MVVVGHSRGAAFATKLVYKNKQATSIVLITPTPCQPTDQATLAAYLRKTYGVSPDELDTLSSEEVEAIRIQDETSFLKEGFSSADHETREGKLAIENFRAKPKNQVLAIALIGLKMVLAYAGITLVPPEKFSKPAIILCGMEDIVCPPMKVMQYYSQFPTTSAISFNVPGAGHMLPLTQQLLTNSAISFMLQPKITSQALKIFQQRAETLVSMQFQPSSQSSPPLLQKS